MPETEDAQPADIQQDDSAPAQFREPVGKAADGARARLASFASSGTRIARAGISRLEQADLAPDLAQNIGSARWFRGSSTRRKAWTWPVSPPASRLKRPASPHPRAARQ